MIWRSAATRMRRVCCKYTVGLTPVYAGAFKLARLHPPKASDLIDVITESVWTNINQICGYLISLPWCDDSCMPGPHSELLHATCSTWFLAEKLQGSFPVTSTHSFSYCCCPCLMMNQNESANQNGAKHVMGCYSGNTSLHTHAHTCVYLIPKENLLKPIKW